MGDGEADLARSTAEGVGGFFLLQADASAADPLASDNRML